MDVINLSLGEPEIEPSRDLVVRALDDAAAAGVIPVVAAGNDYGEFGGGSITSPGSAASAITVGRCHRPTARPSLAEFSSAGPTPVSLQLKPDVSAPGVDILSSVPAREGTWSGFSGTSMAAPHVAGAAALLRQRHPAWTVEQVKSALAQTGTPVGRRGETPSRCARAAASSTCRRPTLRSSSPRRRTCRFGLARAGAPRSTRRPSTLEDAGGGAGAWTVTVEQSRADASALDRRARPRSPSPGRCYRSPSRPARPRASGELTGFVVLTRGAERRRIPYWLRVTAPALARKHARPLATVRASTRPRRAGLPPGCATYRYPADVALAGRDGHLAGPEQVFRVRLRRAVANFGVAVVWRAKGVARRAANRPRRRREPPARADGAADQPQPVPAPVPGQPTPAAGAIRPRPGTYDVVFDGPSRGTAGRSASASGSTTRGRRCCAFASRTVAAWQPAAHPRDRRRLGCRSAHGSRDGRPRPGLGRRSAATSCIRADRRLAPGTTPPRASRSPTTRSRGTWRTRPRSSQHRAPRRRPSSSASSGARGLVPCVTGSCSRSRCTAASNSSLSVRSSFSCDLRRARSRRRPSLEARAAREPRPLSGDQHRHGAGEQRDPEPAHPLILARARRRALRRAQKGSSGKSR